MVEPPIFNTRTKTLVGGHQRVSVLKHLGYTETDVVLVDMPVDEEKALNIALNKIEGEWDAPLLTLLLEEIGNSSVGVEVTGFDAKEIEKLFAENNRKDIHDDDFDVDAAAEESPFALSGDLWHLKNHRLLIGDSTKPEDVSRLMGGKKANLVLSDPPYLIAYKGKAGTIKNDDLDDKAGFEFILSAFKQAENAMASDASIYIFHADTKGELFRRAFREAGFHLSMNCVWKKNTFTLGRMPYQISHEPCLFGWKAKGTHLWNSDRKQSTVWEFDKPHKNDIHSTMKPIPLCAYLIKNSTLTGCIVLDLFSGSFSTGMACEQTDRICYAMELDEKYASASIKRFVSEYGADDVTVERNGETFKYCEVAGNG
jgi:DNA modification methylase